MLSKHDSLVIHCYERGYRVSDDGVVMAPSGTIRSQRVNANGYCTISAVNAQKKHMTLRIHKLVAYQKFGFKSFDKSLEVRHLDGIKVNNSVENIALGTHSENILDMPREARLKKRRNAGRANSHLTDKNILEMREGFSNGETLRWAMEKYHISKTTASYIKNRKTYRYI